MLKKCFVLLGRAGGRQTDFFVGILITITRRFTIFVNKKAAKTQLKGLELMPSRHGSFSHCCFNVGPASKKRHCVNTPCLLDSSVDPYQRPTPYHTMSSKHDTSTQCRFNAGPPSSSLAINHSTLGSAFCWRWCVHRVQDDTDPMSVKCYPFSPSPYFMLAEVRIHSIHHPNSV